MDMQIYDEPPSENIFLHDFPFILVIKWLFLDGFVFQMWLSDKLISEHTVFCVYLYPVLTSQ